MLLLAPFGRSAAKTMSRQPGGGGTLGIIVWGCADGTLAPLAYTRASSAEIY